MVGQFCNDSIPHPQLVKGGRVPNKPEGEAQVPTGAEEITEILAQNLAPILQALDAIVIPDGRPHEPSSVFRVLRTKS